MYREAFNRLPEYFRKPNIEKAYYIGYGSTSDLLQAMNDVRDSRDIDKAYGKTLDLIGGNVGQKRTTEDDDLYRLLIKTKIIANLAKGDIPTINEVSEVLLGDNFLGVQETWVLDDWGNEVAALVFEMKPEFGVLPYDVLERTIAGGVGIKWNLSYNPPGNHLILGVVGSYGEEVTLYPSVSQDPEIEPPLFIGIGYSPMMEEIKLLSPEESNDINAKLDVRSLGNVINQLEQIALYQKDGDKD